MVIPASADTRKGLHLRNVIEQNAAVFNVRLPTASCRPRAEFLRKMKGKPVVRSPGA
jgi:hypothetical protein